MAAIATKGILRTQLGADKNGRKWWTGWVYSRPLAGRC